MSEKRFKGYAEKTGQHHILTIIDLVGEEYNITDDFFKSKDVIFEIVDLLNVMNDTLLKQAEQNHKLSNKNIEQQATIQRFEEYVFSDERILCYNCLFCQEKDIYEVKCKIKGSVDVHGTCQYYKKKGDE